MRIIYSSTLRNLKTIQPRLNASVSSWKAKEWIKKIVFYAWHEIKNKQRNFRLKSSSVVEYFSPTFKPIKQHKTKSFSKRKNFHLFFFRKSEHKIKESQLEMENLCWEWKNFILVTRWRNFHWFCHSWKKLLWRFLSSRNWWIDHQGEWISNNTHSNGK